jgi:hypothetical protein
MQQHRKGIRWLQCLRRAQDTSLYAWARFARASEEQMGVQVEEHIAVLCPEGR